MGKHDGPSAGKTPDGVRGQKPPKTQIKVTTSGGAWLWKQTSKLFGTQGGR